MNLLIISPTPSGSKYSSKTSALASFNQNLIEGLKISNKKINIRIVDIPRSRLVFIKLLFTLLSLPNSQKIIIQYEWNVFGQGVYYLIQFPLFLLILKLFGKKILVVSHAVCFDFIPIFGHKLTSYFFNIFSKIFYFLVVVFSYKVVVTEQELKNRLQKIINNNRIIFIPHGVDINFIKKFPYKTSSNFTLGCFGFLHPYKGSLQLLNLYLPLKNNPAFFSLKLIFVGGESFNLKKDRSYQLFLNEFYKKAKENNIEVTGFVEEEELKNYYSLCDLIVLPHPVFISSSGVLAMTFSFEKPFILSRPLEGYFESPDFDEALKETGLKKEDFIFDLTPESFQKRLAWARKNLDKLSAFSKTMKEKRRWEKMAEKYWQVLSS